MALPSCLPGEGRGPGRSPGKQENKEFASRTPYRPARQGWGGVTVGNEGQVKTGGGFSSAGNFARACPLFLNNISKKILGKKGVGRKSLKIKKKMTYF